MAKQLEESHRLRNTEAEAHLHDQAEKYEEEMKGNNQCFLDLTLNLILPSEKDTLIHQLTTHLASKEPLIRPGKTSIVHLLTRELADADKREVEEDRQRYKEQSEAQQRELQEKERRIAELEDIGLCDCHSS